MKDTFYFPHDYNARNDLKMQALIDECGAAGYGIFWAIIEIMHEEDDHELLMNSTICRAIAKQMATSVEQIETVVKSCLSVELFIEGGNGKIYSERVQRNIDKRIELSEKRSKAGKISAKVRENAASVKQALTSVEQNPTKERKGKERKESKLKESKLIIGDKSPYFKKCTDIYFQFYEKQVGLKPAFPSAEGKHLKELIAKLENSIKNKGGEISEKSVSEAFATLLNKLPKFYKDKIDIKIINSKYDGIIAEIRTKSGAVAKNQMQDILEQRKREREAAAAGG